SLRVIDFRRILSRHNVPYNSTVKKAALVDLFDTYITPNIDKFRSEIQQAIVEGKETKTSMKQGISSTIRPKSQVKEAIEKFELLSSDGENSPPPKQRVYTRRKITKPITNATLEPFSSEGELSPPPVLRARPQPDQVPVNAFESSPAKSNVEEKMFSDETQSGGEAPKKKKKRLKKPTHSYSKIIPTTINPASEVPTQYLNPISDQIEDTSILDEAERYLASKQYRRRRRHQHKSPPYVEYQWGSVWILLSICLVAFLFFIRLQHQSLGYCQSEVDSDGLLIFKCTPCPTHGKCQDGEFLGCDPDYQPKYTPLVSLVNPLRVKCIPNSVRMAKVAAIVEMAQEIINTHAGMVECHQQKSEQITHTGLEEDELLQALAAQLTLQHLNISELWPSVVRELSKQRFHVEVSKDSNGHFVFVSSNPEYSLECRLRQGIISLIMSHIQPLVISIGLMALGVYCTLQYNAYLADEEVVQQLVQQVYRKLRTSKSVPVVQLRDYLLFDIPPRKRRLLWRKVEQIVGMDSNLRITNGEINGEKFIIWEWVGQVEPKP
ncbi:inner nuclear membrane protein enriched at telomere/subtelomere region, partial [Basidiobolus ranarum]